MSNDNGSSDSVHYEGEDGSSSAGSKRSSTQESEGTGGDKEAQSKSLASDETRAVTWTKLLMFFVLFGLAAVAAVTVFRYTTRQEEEDFEVRVSFGFSML